MKRAQGCELQIAGAVVEACGAACHLELGVTNVGEMYVNTLKAT